MTNKKFYLLFIVIFVLIVSTFFAGIAQDEDINDFGMTEEEMLERGEYLSHIGACVSCHTPQLDEYLGEDITPEQLKQIGLAYEETQDTENRLMAGGREFPLGPAGVLISPNLTPDETGLGDWTDEEIEAALRIGVNRDGRRLHPLMPYPNFFRWAESDMQALIMYLRTIPAVENEIVQIGPSGDGIAPELVVDADQLPQLPPDGSDPIALGEYLSINVMSCGECHTPLNPETGAPDFELWLAGGQAYQGPWGIVYGGNITPHETGLDGWTAEDYERVLREGVRIDGRRLVFMPWEDYKMTSDEDMEAIIAYLQSLTPIPNEIPAPAIEDLFLEFVEE